MPPSGRIELHVEVTEPLLPWAEAPETVVFCHGVATNADIWAGWLPLIAARHRGVRFDTRGFGRSSRAADAAGWQMDRLADDILAVADEAGAQRFHLIGESMGGTVCLQLASRPESRLLSLCCVSTSHRGGKIGAVHAWRRRAEIEGMKAWSDRMMSDRFAPGAVTPAQWRWFAAEQERTDVHHLLAAVELLVGTDLSVDVGRIAVPTLLLAPDSSPFVGLDLACDLRMRIPGSELGVFPGVRHGLAFSHAADCAAQWLDFVGRRCGSAG